MPHVLQITLRLDPKTEEAILSIAESLKKLASLPGIEEALDLIASEIAPPAPPVAVSFLLVAISTGGKADMAKAYKAVLIRMSKGMKAGAVVQISDSDPTVFALFGVDKAGIPGASLPAGASAALTGGVGANGTPGTLVQDAAPGAFDFTDQNGKVWKGLQSIASAVFTPNTVPDVNDPFPVSWAITGGSGDAGSASFETAVGVEVSELVAVVVPPAPPAPGA